MPGVIRQKKSCKYALLGSILHFSRDPNVCAGFQIRSPKSV